MISIIAASAILLSQPLPEADFIALQKIKDQSLNATILSACGDSPPASFAGWLGRAPATEATFGPLLKEDEAFLDYTIVPEGLGVQPGLYGIVVKKQADTLVTRTKLLTQSPGKVEKLAVGHAQNMGKGSTATSDLRSFNVDQDLNLVSLSLNLTKEFRAELLSASSITISPDKWLWAVSFACLTVPTSSDDSDTLGQKRVIRYVHSASSWAWFRSRTASSAGTGIAALAVPAVDTQKLSDVSIIGRAISADSRTLSGDPRGLSADSRNVVNRPNGSIGAQSGKEAEAREVLSSQGESGPILDEKFNFKALQDSLSSKETVLISAHWVMAPNASSMSGIIVSQGKDKAPDVVTPARLGSIVGKADKVIYTFSDIIFGHSVNADPFVSLMVATLTTGAKSVLATQWRAADTYTTEVLKRALAKVKEDPALPLVNAVHSSIDEVPRRPEHWHPYYWARFLSVEG